MTQRQKCKGDNHMTLGEKIAKQRKVQNLTQEQLAQLLGVSRQTISKWESNIAYPETDKLIRLGNIFHCSMDYLLKDEVTKADGTVQAPEVPVLEQIHTIIQKQCRERKSEKQLCGMPLYHIGRNARGFFAIGLKARGVFAIGLRAKGVVSLGMLSMGILSIGLLSLGLLAFGTFSLGLIALGAIALGLFAVGAVSIGVVSIGALSVGCFSGGAAAYGKYMAVGDYAQAAIAIGKTEAVGSVYGHVGQTSNADLDLIHSWLAIHVPSYLAWAKELFQLLFFF
jgi:transcriptional regulator with XRE-family HTH domain